MSRGFVSLVGAGPGDPELISVRGLRRLRAAQVVVYDRLIHPALLEDVPRGAERVFAGKASGSAVMSQQAIEALLIERARACKRVVRLKGGDPFLFGREPATPAAVVSAGTWPQQRTVIATLGTLDADVAGAGLRSPAIIVVGEVCRVPALLAAVGSTVLQEAG